MIGSASHKELKQLARVAFFLPLITTHNNEAISLGRQLSNHKISEKRLFHIIRSEPPNDLIQLKRVLQQAKLTQINWYDLGNSLYYWGKGQKRQLMQDFYLHPQQTEQA